MALCARNTRPSKSKVLKRLMHYDANRVRHYALRGRAGTRSRIRGLACYGHGYGQWRRIEGLVLGRDLFQ